MKILHCISSLDKGGAETHVAMLAENQAKKNEVRIIYFKGNHFWKKKLYDSKIKFKFIGWKRIFNIFEFLKVYIFLINEIKKCKPDIVHAHLSSAELICAVIKFFNKKLFRLVISKHLDSFFFEGSNKKFFFFQGLFIDKFIFKQAEHLIFISKFTSNYFLKKIKISKKKTSILYYGFKRMFYSSSKKEKKRFIEKHKLSNKDFIITNISRHVYQKSLQTLLKSIYILIHEKKIVNLKLILIGSGPMTSILKKLSKTLNLQKHIIWIKYYQNVKNIYDISDIFVLTSRHEGLGLVLLEAMNSSLPIVAYNGSTMKEVVKNNVNGLLVKKHNPNNFANEILKLTNYELKRKIKENSKKILKNKFSFKFMILKMQKIYSKLV